MLNIISLRAGASAERLCIETSDRHYLVGLHLAAAPCLMQFYRNRHRHVYSDIASVDVLATASVRSGIGQFAECNSLSATVIAGF